MSVGRSNAVDRPVAPESRSRRKRSFVSAAVPKPANIRIVQSFDRYMDTYGPRVYGNLPGERSVAVHRLDGNSRYRWRQTVLNFERRVRHAIPDVGRP